MLYVWLATYESTFVEHPHPESAYSVGMLALAVQILMMPLCGMAVDRYGVRPCMMFGTIGTIVFAPPLMAWLYHTGATSSILPQILFALIASIYGAGLPVFMTSVFPEPMRFTGAANGYVRPGPSFISTCNKHPLSSPHYYCLQH